MKVVLRHRYLGVHSYVRHTIIPGNFRRYAKSDPNSNRPDDYLIDEDRLLAALPEGFLPTKSCFILLTVDEGFAGTGQRGLKQFRNWAKYFPCYVISLIRSPRRKKKEETPHE